MYVTWPCSWGFSLAKCPVREHEGSRECVFVLAQFTQRVVNGSSLKVNL